MKSDRRLSRRRALTIFAAAAAIPMLPVTRGRQTPTGYKSYTWRGSAMGTNASITFRAARLDQAQDVTEQCLAEVERLENIFSLYRDHSELCELNRHGRIRAPSQDMRRLLALVKWISAMTAGAFDATVQPLWRLNADWFTENPGGANVPAADLVKARALVDYRGIDLANGEVNLRHGQQLTLNGIAQGYITDRIGELLKSMGWNNLLINLGEYRAIASTSDATPFHIGLSHSNIVVPLADTSIASSSSDALRFPSMTGRHTHLLNPATAQSPQLWRAVHVHHPSAAIADGLSTAFCNMSANQIATVQRKIPKISVWAEPYRDDIAPAKT